ncbi:MAG: uracil-xanthine permease, partial [Acetatifactor sp.]|nr:uracil-xanthine permease [Acetatifactor sp.]
IISFLSPVVAFLSSIPSCVMGGVCMTLYGFIAVSGLKMLQQVDLNDNKNLFVVSAILISCIGGLSLNFGSITITAVSTSLILGIIVNTVLSGKSNAKNNDISNELKKSA